MRFALAMCRALLRLYPRSVRTRFGAGMEETFRAMIERPPSALGRSLAAARGLADLLIGAVRERWRGDLNARGVEAMRHRRGGRDVMGGWWRDLKQAARALRRSPAFTVVAATSLALGISANIVVFSAANTLLLRPLPGIPNHDRVVDLGRTDRGQGFDTFTYPDFRDVREQATALQSASAVAPQLLSISQGAEGTRAMGFGVEPSYFSILGARPQLGRFLAPDEGVGGTDEAFVVVSHRWWQEQMGGAPDVVGRTLLLNRVPFTVIGVAEPEFRGNLIGVEAEVYFSLALVPSLLGQQALWEHRGSSWLTGIGLLREGSDVAMLNAQLQGVAERLAEAYPETNQSRGFRAVTFGPVPGFGRTGVQLFITALFAMVGLVLLVTCTNVAGMSLARATARRHEMAVRLALGSGRGRLIRQLTTETLLVFVLGGGLGLALAVWGLGWIRPEVIPTPVPINVEIGVDWRVVTFTIGTTLLTGLMFGLLPAARSTRVGLTSSMAGAGRAETREGGRLRFAFAASQVGFSLVLLVAAGLFLRSLQRASEVEVGFDPSGAYVTTIDLSIEGYDEVGARETQAALLARLREENWVRSASLSTDLPLDLSSSSTQVVPEGWSGEGSEGRFSTDTNRVSDGYFRTLGIPVVEGRAFEASDDAEAPRVAVVSRRFAEEAWPGEQAVGRTFAFRGTPWEVVGVAADTKNQFLMEDTRPLVYLPLAQDWSAATEVTVRSELASGAVVPALRRNILAEDPNISLGPIGPLERLTSVGILPQRIAATLTTGLGLLALVLSGLGIYGVVSFSVGRRSREIGIRMALGADRGHIVRRFVRFGLTLAVPGLIIGGLASLGAARLLRSLLLDLSPYDPVALGGVAALLLGMVLMAAWFPARRAAAVHPAVSLRHDQ